MVQAARSVKQNIAEGLTDGQTSFETEIKLLGIAKGSNQELLEDYQDYLQHHNLPEWAHARHPGAPGPPPENARKTGDARNTALLERFNRLHAFCKAHSDEEDYRPFYHRWTDEEMANTAICHLPHGR